jgi:hypothetical protein
MDSGENWPVAPGLEVETTAASLMTPLAWVEGDVLTYLERHGATPLRRLVRELEWTSPLVMMAVGALVREGLVQGIRHELEVVLQPNRSWTPGSGLLEDAVPEAWGG